MIVKVNVNTCENLANINNEEGDDVMLCMLERIRRRREELRYTQFQVGQRLGYESANGYHQLETGKVKMTVSHLNALAALLELSVKEILCGN